MNSGHLFIVSAPSGAGKTSLVKAALEKDPDLVVSVSHTTRPKRAGETDGLNYHFVTDTQFDAMVDQQAFLEHARVFDHQYGTSTAEVSRLREQGKDVILEIDWQGADLVRSQIEDVISLFILPPSIEVLKQRLENRAQDSAEVINRRLAEARLEMAQAPRYNYILVNDHFETALSDMLAVVRATRLRASAQLQGNMAVRTILSVT